MRFFSHEPFVREAFHLLKVKILKPHTLLWNGLDMGLGGSCSFKGLTKEKLHIW
jgi:hypothetical protein